MKILITVALAFLISACSDRDEERTVFRNDHYCTSESVKVRSEFILSCITGANPKSDEEPEGWLQICQRMAEETFCPLVKMEITQRCGSRSGCFWIEVDRKPAS